MIGTACFLLKTLGIGVLLLAAACQPGAARTLCVNPDGAVGCFASIGAAVSAALPGDTIRVAHGIYKEYVVVSKALSLIGECRENTIIDAVDKPFGINIDGFNNRGLSGVVISGFTVRNANNAGIVISNASHVTVSENSVLNNDKGLLSGDDATCPTLSNFSYLTRAADCGEGIFISGVDHSTVANNQVSSTGNAGGILISDETGPTYDNLIADNNPVVRDTALDCGTTLPLQSGRCICEERTGTAPSQHFRHAAYQICILSRLVVNRFAFQENIDHYSTELFV